MTAAGKGKLEQSLRWIEENWIGEKATLKTSSAYGDYACQAETSC